MSVELTPWQRPGPSREQRRTDVLTGVAVAAGAMLNLTLVNSVGQFFLGPPPAWPEQVFWTLACTLPLVARRRFPIAVAIVISVALIGGQYRHSPEQQVASGALYVALYTVGAWGLDRVLARRVRLGIIAAMFGWLAVSAMLSLADLPPNAFPNASGPLEPLLASIVSGVLVNVLFFGFAYLFGDTAWTSARRQHQLEVQAEELRRSQADAAQAAVMGERVRIARELHDVVAHHVSVMGVQAAATRRVMDKDPGKARTTLAAVEQSARTAVDELRRMLNLLRAGGTVPDEPPGAGVDQVGELVVNARDAGLETSFGVYGEPAPLPESLSQATYRIVQEAVTNTLKHAGATNLDVRIRYHAAELEIDVADNGRGTAGRPSAGLGLIGMRERVTAHDGTLTTDPRPTGGFRVRARFPLVRVTA
ncbi:sensor histidine kinase [Polymorphospora sp. NPDC051019]|uniref:sensor histidine kinase n=1 Tax=Polymorphospora sp. NPDC051019 TaxID=3155725 RepID=UPI003423EB2E